MLGALIAWLACILVTSECNGERKPGLEFCAAGSNLGQVRTVNVVVVHT